MIVDSAPPALGTFVSSFVIVFREVLEVALVLAIVLTATTGLKKRGAVIGWGLAIGGAFTAVVAWSFDRITASFEGFGQEILQSSILIVSAMCIGATVIWMKRHGKALAAEAKEVSRKVMVGAVPPIALIPLIGFTVARDGTEVVILSGGLIAGGGGLNHIVLGTLAALAVGAAALYVFVRGSTRLPLGPVFNVTAVLLVLLAAGMMAQAIALLQSAGVASWSERPLWDTSHIIPGESWLGFTLHTLVGYVPRPSLAQLTAYIGTLSAISFGAYLVSRTDGVIRRAVRPVAAAALVLGVILYGTPVEAIDTIYSPAVELGEVEVELRSSYVIDGDEEEDGSSQSRLGVGYGITDEWMVEGYGNFVRESGDDLHTEGWSIESRYELTEPGAFWLDLGLYGEFTGTTRGSDAEEIEGKILIERSTPSIIGTLNVIFEQEVGGDREEDLEGGLAFVSRYRFSPAFEPGVEVHSEFGELNDIGSFDEQEHLIGPCVWGEITHHVGYQVAWVMGVSDAAADHVVRAALEYEF